MASIVSIVSIAPIISIKPIKTTSPLKPFPHARVLIIYTHILFPLYEQETRLPAHNGTPYAGMPNGELGTENHRHR